MHLLPICLFSLFFLFPSLSSSCLPEPQPVRLSCNNSIEIRPPFYLTNGTTPLCDDAINVKCGSVYKGPQVFLFSFGNVWFSLENILYASEGPEKHSLNRLVVRDPPLEQLLNTSDCGNLQISVQTSSHEHFNYEQYLSFSKNITSFCHSLNLSSRSPIITYEYTLNYSTTTATTLPIDCYKKPPNASFEWTFSFDVHGVLFPLSAQYSYNLLPQQGCFNQSVVVGDCGDECNPIKGDAGKTGSPGKTSRPATKSILIGITVGSGAFIIACLILILMLQNCKHHPKCISSRKYRPERNIEMLLEKYGSFALKRYKYAVLKKITCSFQYRLGKGGFGTVYKGTLQDGHLVAVKLLHNSTSHVEEFLNEVLSIGRTSHVNVLSLLGFCVDGSKHALVYEYMPNGSLDNYIYSENPRKALSWEKLYGIAIGIAHGLEYLHRGCNARIVHFDIKPQNILLDEDFNPKIADFGLAKLCPPKESIISLAEMRGTVGFIAPEVFSRSFGVVSAKSDVYSYGMMLLEMVGGRRNTKPSAENPSQVYFPHWLYDQLAEGGKIQACDVSIENEEIARKMGLVGLWCTQTLPVSRPSMSIVVEMLQKGLDELEMPPKPTLCNSPPHLTMQSTSYST
ncbi:Protein kinase family protein [Rhynchospora pubera]|uniref:Protein kinase family protein n=1 Tax=Rhynchospora pubera TaxID=906938 RepID=A0AAV8FTE4_9POAL|nr:Protein kinase family protein [Rhynchospora pubera]